MTIFDLLYPRRCGVCGLLGDEPICAICEAGFPRADSAVHAPEWRGALDGVARLYRYEGRAEQAVRRLKFSRATALAAPMAERFAKFAMRVGLDEPDLIVPVPIHWSRRYLRGFNQSELLCEGFDRSKVRTDVLRRIRATRPQVGLTPDERRVNLSGAFRAEDALRGLSVLLVDDVITTGHTVGECAKTLKAAGALVVNALAFCGN